MFFLYKKNLLMFTLCALATLYAYAPIINQSQKKQAVIFDLGDVLFIPSKLSMAYHEIGLATIAWYCLWSLQSPYKLQQKMYAVLHHFDALYPCDTHAYNQGRQLPNIITAWLKGTKKPEDIVRDTILLMDILEKNNFFSSRHEKAILTKVIEATFNPDILVRYIKPNQDAIQLLQTLSQSATCEMYIISNWDPASFALLYASEAGQTIFKYFKPENIIISGICGLIKPDKEIFEKVVQKESLNPAHTIFIDDENYNILAAQACGMQVIPFNNGTTFNDVQQQLQARGFLPRALLA